MLGLQGLAVIGVSGSVLLAAAGIVVTLLASTWTISSRLSTVSTKLDGLDSVHRLAGQLEMIDASRAARIPEDISAMREDISSMKQDMSSMRRDIDDVAENAAEITDVASSVDTIERSVTNVDFEGIERAVGRLVDGGLPTGNSVEHELRESGRTVVVSLSSLEDDRTEVSFRFDEHVGARELLDPTRSDELLTELGSELFESTPALHAVSPRQLEAVVPSSDLDDVVTWVTCLLDRLDENCVELHESRDAFDEQLEARLG